MRWTAKEAWDRFLLYVPVVVMAALALGSYWLVRTAPEVAVAERVRPVSHEPDYFIEGFSIKNFDGTGRIRTEVAGSKANHFPDTQTLEIDKVHIRALDESGRVTTASALKAISDKDASEVQLIGNAVVVRQAADPADQRTPRLEYRGEFLHLFTDTEVVKSHKPVELLRGRDRFSADQLEFDNVAQVLVLNGRVKGTLVPDAP
jgi:lipopolysaccharide export system protein LptC